MLVGKIFLVIDSSNFVSGPTVAMLFRTSSLYRDGEINGFNARFEVLDVDGNIVEYSPRSSPPASSTTTTTTSTSSTTTTSPIVEESASLKSTAIRLVIVYLCLLSGFFAGIETSYISKQKIEESSFTQRR